MRKITKNYAMIVLFIEIDIIIFSIAKYIN